MNLRYLCLSFCLLGGLSLSPGFAQVNPPDPLPDESFISASPAGPLSRDAKRPTASYAPGAITNEA